MDSIFKFVYKFLFLLPLLFLCAFYNPFSSYASYEWQTTDNGLKIWTDKGSAVKYNWDGDSRGGVIHGAGTLTITGGQKSSEKINAYYGTVNEQGLFNNEEYSQKYIGKFKNWNPLSSKEYDGFGVLVLNTGYVYISVFEHNMPKNNAKTYIYKNNAIFYEGTCEKGCDGMITGQGSLFDTNNKNIYNKGFFLNGTLINGERHSEKYIGPIKNSQKSGLGKEYLSKYINYEGYFENDKFSGDGVLTIPKEAGLGNEAKYAGSWKNGMLNGQASYIFGQEAYDGEWLDNKKSGQGTMLYSDGSLYVGEWKENKKTKGRMEYSNGDNYIGEWNNNLRNGEGIYEYHDGSVYTGDWQDDLQYGQGELKTSSFTYSGSWEGGYFHGKGEISFENGDFYSGDFNQGRKEGQGIYQFKNGNIYEGSFENDTFNGVGEYQFNADKDYGGIITFKGNFEDGKPKGYGYFAMQADGAEKPEYIIESESWAGMKLPDYGKFIIPAERMVYEGPLYNGRPVENAGKWFEYIDEEENANQVKRKAPEWLRDTSSFIKEHKAKWDKFYKIAGPVLAVASSVPVVNFYATPILTAFVVVDTGLIIVSSGVDCYEDDKDACKDLAAEVAINAALAAVPKVLPPAAKRFAKTKVGQAALNAAKAAKNSIKTAMRLAIKAGIKRIKPPLKDISKYVSKKIDTIKKELSPLMRQFMPGGKQYISKDFYKKNRAAYLKKAKKNLTGNKNKNADILEQNMKALSKNVCSMCSKIKGSCAFHHIISVDLPGFDVCRGKLSAFGIDINDAINGICLPTGNKSLAQGSKHSGSHTKEYVKHFDNACASAESFDDILDVLEKAKGKLMEGSLPVHRPEKHEVYKSFLQNIRDEINSFSKGSKPSYGK